MTWLVVGLGNPGQGYAKTRHNVGFMVAAELASSARVQFSRPALARAEIARMRMGPLGLVAQGEGEEVAVVRPLTYMNESGRAVGVLARRGRIDPEQLIVVHDELDLRFGQLRVKFGGGDNGHRGLKSIRAHLHTGDFYRVRVGIGRPTQGDAIDHVLAHFDAGEAAELGVLIRQASDAVISIIEEGLVQTQNRFNS